MTDDLEFRSADDRAADLATALPAQLAPGGSAVMLGNWEIGAQHAWDVHPRAWLGAVRVAIRWNVASPAALRTMTSAPAAPNRRASQRQRPTASPRNSTAPAIT